jgi:hypothetical protein
MSDGDAPTKPYRYVFGWTLLMVCAVGLVLLGVRSAAEADVGRALMGGECEAAAAHLPPPRGPLRDQPHERTSGARLPR